VSPNESRTGTPLMDAPESITIVPRAIIDDQKAFNLEDVLRNVAGVARQAGRGFNDDFLIRGFRPAEGSMILRDQFPQAIDDLSPPAELWNVDRVEVLKGPNAFLYGRDIGSFNLYRPALDVSGPVPETSDRLLYRLMASTRPPIRSATSSTARSGSSPPRSPGSSAPIRPSPSSSST
jgi:outer membrane receptor protein involved in Fe transport